MKKQLIFLFVLCTLTTLGQTVRKNKPTDFVPEGYALMQTLTGDLNKDGVEDCVLIIKGTDEENKVTDEYRGDLDLNRRGIIILFKKEGHYELALKNESCFSSEYEDGGVYFAPDLSVSLTKGNIYLHYAHGRYGYSSYTFRYQHGDFELIGYDSAYRSTFVSDWVAFDEMSINFSTKKKLVKEIIKINDSGKETYKEIWTDLQVDKRAKLSEIDDLDDFRASDYYKEM